jgi:toxin CptA
MTSAPAIGFEYRPSRWVARLLGLVTLLALLAVVLSGVPWILRALLALAVMVACRHALRRLQLPISAVGWARGCWTLRGLDGADDPATLLSSRILGRLVLLRVASQRYGKLTLWLMPDNSDADIRRRLRMRLAIWQGALETETPPQS